MQFENGIIQNDLNQDGKLQKYYFTIYRFLKSIPF